VLLRVHQACKHCAHTVKNFFRLARGYSSGESLYSFGLINVYEIRILQHLVRIFVLLPNQKQLDIYSARYGCDAEPRFRYHFDWSDNVNLSAVLWLQQIRERCCRRYAVASNIAWWWTCCNGSGMCGQFVFDIRHGAHVFSPR